MARRELCTMCNEVPATTEYGGIPVCSDCAGWLSGIQGELEGMEAEDPTLAEAGRRVEESGRTFVQDQQRRMN